MGGESSYVLKQFNLSYRQVTTLNRTSLRPFPQNSCKWCIMALSGLE